MRPGREVDYSFLSSAEVKIEGICTSTSPVRFHGLQTNSRSLPCIVAVSVW